MNNIANGEPKESRGKIIKKDIYVIKNNINNKVYIGQTITPRIRFNAHKNAARKNSPLLIHQAMRRYGVNNFYFEILESQIEDYDEKEKYYIKMYNSFMPNGYNMTEGGGGLNQLSNINYYQFKFDDNLLEDVCGDLMSNEFTLSEIARKYNVNNSVIDNINLGKTYRNNNYDYPLLKNNSWYLDESKINKVVDLLSSSTMSLEEIANIMETELYNIGRINRGEIKSNWNKKFPIREEIFTLKLIQDIHDEILNTWSTFPEIARKFNVSLEFIKSIQQGKTNTLDNYSYPLRKIMRLGNKGLSKIEVLKVIELLKQKPSLSEREISRKLNINRSTICGIKSGTTKAYIIENQKYPIR